MCLDNICYMSLTIDAILGYCDTPKTVELVKILQEADNKYIFQENSCTIICAGVQCKLSGDC